MRSGLNNNLDESSSIANSTTVGTEFQVHWLPGESESTQIASSLEGLLTWNHVTGLGRPASVSMSVKCF